MATTKKNPIVPIVIVIVALVVLGIVGYLLMNKEKMTSVGTQKSGGAFSSIKDALSKSLSLECDYKDTTGNSTKSYIKNGAIRADIASSTPENSGSMIMKDRKMYFWNGKTGFMMEVPESTVGETEDKSVSKGNEVLKDMEAYKDSCKPAVVADSLFTPPSDVKFSDFSKMMPSGVPKTDANGQMNQQDVEKYMKQYQQDSETPQGN